MYKNRRMDKIASNRITCKTMITGGSSRATRRLTLAMMLTPTDNAALEE
jgi:hypothetical protein